MRGRVAGVGSGAPALEESAPLDDCAERLANTSDETTINTAREIFIKSIRATVTSRFYLPTLTASKLEWVSEFASGPSIIKTEIGREIPDCVGNKQALPSR